MITILLYQLIDKFFCILWCFPVNQHAYLTLLGPDYHRLLSHSPYHIEGIPGFAPQGQLQCILFHALLQGLLKLMVNLKEAVCRA